MLTERSTDQPNGRPAESLLPASGAGPFGEAAPATVKGYRWKLRGAPDFDAWTTPPQAQSLQSEGATDEIATLSRFFEFRYAKLYGTKHPSESDMTLKGLPDPFLFRDMKRAVARILGAIDSGERIIIFGDYDVDGTASCAMLRRFFLDLGLKVDVYIPDRLTEGYGLNAVGLGNIKEAGGGLVVTVDNGISAVDACQTAKRLGIDVIVTDHHDCPEVLPEAFALINPKRPGCTFPYKMLAGVGVAFYLMAALRVALRNPLATLEDGLLFARDADVWRAKSSAPAGDDQVPPGHPSLAILAGRVTSLRLKDFLDYVALGTIADLAPLDGVNHVLCQTGLRVMQEHVCTGARPGLRYLLELAGWTPENPIDSQDIGFKIGPRLNAAGRLGTALAAAEVLETASVERARELALFLHGENQDRQTLERRITHEAFEQARALGGLLPDAFVFHAEDWHTGLVGIVASRLLEKYYRPTLVFGTLNGLLKGSGRSTHAFDLFGALTTRRDRFISFGGHKMAVGMTIERETLPWLRKFLAEKAAEGLLPGDKSPPLLIDGILALEDLNGHFLTQIQTLEPFGIENPRPKWLIRRAVIRHVKRMGKSPEAGHARIQVQDEPDSRTGGGLARQGSGGPSRSGSSAPTHWLTAFGLAEPCERLEAAGLPVDIIVEGKMRSWKGTLRAELNVVDLAPCSP